MTLRAQAALPVHAQALAELLGDSHGCYCQYWFFSGDKNAWQLRCMQSPDDNAQSLQAECLGTVPPGIVVFDDELAVGWLRVAPLGRMKKLTQHGTYRRLALTEDQALSIACIYVRPEARGRGVMRMLLSVLPDFCASLGAHRVYAFPRGGDERLDDAQRMMGVMRCFSEIGFVRDGGDDAYPVLRLECLR